MSSFLHELKRRRVFRTAALYLAATWLVLQVADLFFDAYGASAATMQTLFAATAIGFPIALVLSWVYDLRTTGQIGSTTETERTFRTLDTAIVALAVLAAGFFAWSQIRGPGTATPPDDIVAVSAEPGIAVLPLANIDGNPDDDYLADGLTEELLNVLASMPQLRVIARSSAFAFKNSTVDVRELGRELGVDHVLDGSVRRSGEQLRIAVQLVDTTSGNPLWSVTYDRELVDIFEVQQDIAERIAGTLQLSLFGDPRPIIRRTTPDVYAMYLRALFRYRSPGADNYELAFAELEQALDLDPEYAPAWTLLSSILHNQAIIGARDFQSAHETALSAIDRALDIDPNYAYAISSRAWLAMMYERDYAAAATYYRRAIELAPNEPTILANSGVLARTLGRTERAIELTNRGLDLNPVNASGHSNLSDQLYQARRFSDAITAAERSLEIAPGNPTALVNLAAAQLFAENPAATLEIAESFDIDFYRLFFSALALFDLGRDAEANEALSLLTADFATMRAAYIAAIHAYRGATDEAFRWLQRAIDERQRVLSMRAEPLFESLRDDPRWIRILEQLGLSDAQVAGIEV
jgi:TolB-like protein/Tfp pilus assembly protein PilF